MHLGSIWTWNRAVYDPADGGHLRIELRALPAGPTTIDMAAVAAFLPGLTLAAAEDASTWTRLLPFEQARDSFLDAARHGIDAMLLSPFQRGDLERVPARELALRLLEPRDRRWSTTRSRWVTSTTCSRCSPSASPSDAPAPVGSARRPRRSSRGSGVSARWSR